jgi:hypothetical protein
MINWIKNKILGHPDLDRCLNLLTLSAHGFDVQKEATQVAFYIWAGLGRMQNEGIPADFFMNGSKKIVKEYGGLNGPNSILCARAYIGMAFFDSIQALTSEIGKSEFFKIVSYIANHAKEDARNRVLNQLGLKEMVDEFNAKEITKPFATHEKNIESLSDVDAGGVYCPTCKTYSPSNTWGESSAGTSFKKCPKCSAHVQVDITAEKPSESEELVVPRLVDDIVYCDKCRYFNQKSFFRPPYSRQDLKGFLYCFSCENKIGLSDGAQKVAPELQKIIDDQSIEAYKIYYKQYSEQCKVFNNLTSEQTFEVVNRFNTALNWLVNKYGHSSSIIAAKDEKFQEILNELDVVHGKSILDKAAVALLKLNLCLWKYACRLDLEVLSDNWEALVDLEGCDVEESKIQLDLNKNRANLNPAAAWPFPSGARP